MLFVMSVGFDLVVWIKKKQNIESVLVIEPSVMASI